jgi:hypothetical protein
MEFLSFLGAVFLFLLAIGFILGAIWVSIEWESRGHKIELLKNESKRLSEKLDTVENNLFWLSEKRKGKR